MDKAQAIRLDASIPDWWWEFAIKNALHVYNCTPVKRLDWRTPFELINGKKPDVSHIRVFGCAAYVRIPDAVRKNKLSSKAELMIFIGYTDGMKGYKFMHLSNTIFMSANALFDEELFPKSKTRALPKYTTLGKPSDSNNDDDEDPSESSRQRPRQNCSKDGPAPRCQDRHEAEEQTIPDQHVQGSSKDSESVQEQDQRSRPMHDTGLSAGTGSPDVSPERSTETTSPGDNSFAPSKEDFEYNQTRHCQNTRLYRSMRHRYPTSRSDNIHGTNIPYSVKNMEKSCYWRSVYDRDDDHDNQSLPRKLPYGVRHLQLPTPSNPSIRAADSPQQDVHQTSVPTTSETPVKTSIVPDFEMDSPE
jgi:hypothetical protein